MKFILRCGLTNADHFGQPAFLCVQQTTYESPNYKHRIYSQLSPYLSMEHWYWFHEIYFKMWFDKCRPFRPASVFMCATNDIRIPKLQTPYLFAAFPVPCRLTEEGHEYNGTLSMTDDGETCDHWIDAPVSYVNCVNFVKLSSWSIIEIYIIQF